MGGAVPQACNPSALSGPAMQARAPRSASHCQPTIGPLALVAVAGQQPAGPLILQVCSCHIPPRQLVLPACDDGWAGQAASRVMQQLEEAIERKINFKSAKRTCCRRLLDRPGRPAAAIDSRRRRRPGRRRPDSRRRGSGCPDSRRPGSLQCVGK